MLGVALSGCGPLRYRSAARGAETALNRAREAGAEDIAPYAFRFAEANLRQARSEAARSAYDDALRHARLAEEHAATALADVETAADVGPERADDADD